MSQRKLGRNILSSKGGLSESEARRLEEFRLKREEELKELQSIKKLLVLHLIKSGTKPKEIGKALGVTGRSIRNMFPMKGIKKSK